MIICGQISIHALREEGDESVQILLYTDIQFQSTPSARRATVLVVVRVVAPFGFQSTPSARRATRAAACWSASVIFQSTPSARRATRPRWTLSPTLQISIHALREESDAADIRVEGMTAKISIHALREESDSTVC